MEAACCSCSRAEEAAVGFLPFVRYLELIWFGPILRNCSYEENKARFFPIFDKLTWAQITFGDALGLGLAS